MNGTGQRNKKTTTITAAGIDSREKEPSKQLRIKKERKKNQQQQRSTKRNMD